MSPSPSSDGSRLIYAIAGQGIESSLWISSLSGGAPVRLTNASAGSEWGGSWSPDGRQFVYYYSQAGKTSTLMTVRTSGNAAPLVLKEKVGGGLPDWSPDGNWITYKDEKGWNLISPDGKTVKFIGKIKTPYLAFSKNGKLLYGIKTGETGADQDRVTLFSLDPVTLKQTVIKDLGQDLQPVSPFNPGVRLSLAPDGKAWFTPPT
jgi:dipeptidyl aminopeptidase/acylaminoacyl peptidase